MSQDGLQERSEKAKIAITNDFENMLLDLSFTICLEHQASQASPKTAKKPPKMHPDSLQELSKKKGPIQIDC